MTQLSNHIKDTLIAPGASAFTQTEIPDLSNESRHWIGIFFLNSMLRGAWKPPLNAYTYNYLRRVEAAFREHANARAESLAFADGQSQSPSRYAAAIFHWENFLGQAWHAYKTLQKAFDIPLFERDSGSVEERLNKLYNQMKHAESCIENGQMLEGATVPVWLTNEGLLSIDAALTFAETAEVLRDLAKWANTLEDPRTAGDKLRNDFP